MLLNKIDLSERVKNTSGHSLKSSNKNTVSINLEFLDKCQFSCEGCFVSRRNNYSQEDLNMLLILAKEMACAKLDLNELVLGPTDIFATNNLESLLENKTFISLFDYFTALTFNTTLKSDPAIVAEYMSMINSKLNGNAYLEAFIVVDIDKIVSGDLEYTKQFETNLQILNDYNTNIIFSFNAYDGTDLPEFVNKFIPLINEKYNSHYRMNVSFFRSQSDRVIKKHLDHIKSQQKMVSETDNLYLNFMEDNHIGGLTYTTLTFKDHKLYINPFIHDFVFDESPEFEVECGLESIFDLKHSLLESSYDYTKNTDSCSKCEKLSICAQRNIISYMSAHEITNCLIY